MASYKTEAIIVNRLNLGESDRILTLFSPNLGKIRAICKGSRKTKSKFGGHTELFSLGDFVINSGKSLDVVSDVTLKRNYFAENPDMEKIKTTYYFAEVINRLIPDHAEHRDIYELLLFCLEAMDEADIPLIQLIFVARILMSLGIYPELTNCIKCEEKPDKDNLYFTKSGGGLVDSHCSLHFEDATRIDENTVKLWRYIANAPLSSTLKLQVDAESVKDAAALANTYIHCVTQIDYKSLRVLS